MSMRVLFYGAGVIGSIYATTLSNAGYDVTVFARGNRLAALESKSLLYHANGVVKEAPISVISKLDTDDVFDFVIVAVRYEQIEAALTELRSNKSPNVVTMVNNPKGYDAWEHILGPGRLIPAFAGGGGRIENDILYYALTPGIIQSTTFGEVDGKTTDRIRALASIFKSCKIPYSISRNMGAWQKSHLALVIPLANGVYYDGGDNYSTAKNKQAIRLISSALKTSFRALKNAGVPITPLRLNVFRVCPLWIMNVLLRLFCATKLAEVLVSHVHSIKDEMAMLESEFNDLLTGIG